jgi:hypothetical protein
MKEIPAILATVVLCAACEGTISEARQWRPAQQEAGGPGYTVAGYAGRGGGVNAGGPAVPGSTSPIPPGTQPLAGTSPTGPFITAGTSAPPTGTANDPGTRPGTLPPATGGQAGNAGTPAVVATGGSAAPTTSEPSGAVGTGDITKPVSGPAPTEATNVGGAPFVLVKNWDFGTDGNIRNTTDLISEFQFHDQFNTIANGSNYGAVMVAPTAATTISVSGLNLPNNKQPVEDPAHPTREFGADSLTANVRPLSASATTVSVSAHDTGCGSFMAKWKLPSGGANLKQDLLWETRARMPNPLAGYWFALWTAGNQWNKGAEMDVLESFGAPNINAQSFHVNSVGGTDAVSYSSWPSSLSSVGVPSSDTSLSDWHIWTWVYSKDDSYKAYYDGVLVQHGTIHWTLGGTQGGQSIDMDFLFDFTWGHTGIQEVNISLPTSMFPLVYEIDYSRVYLR